MTRLCSVCNDNSKIRIRNIFYFFHKSSFRICPSNCLVFECWLPCMWEVGKPPTTHALCSPALHQTFGKMGKMKEMVVENGTEGGRVKWLKYRKWGVGGKWDGRRDGLLGPLMGPLILGDALYHAPVVRQRGSSCSARTRPFEGLLPSSCHGQCHKKGV